MTGDDLDQITTPDGAYMLAYHCGCIVKVVDGWAVDVTHCDEPAHEFIGTCGE